MLTPTMALMTRTLREDVRTWKPGVLRLLLVLVIFWMMFLAHMESRYRGAPGLEFFKMTSYVSCYFLMLAAASYFATPITEEKEEMSLGLLRMAGINPVAILLGKSVPRQFTAIVLLSLQLPFTLLAITLGGVTMHQVLSAYVTLLAEMLLLGNLGLLVSVLSKHSSSASWRMVALLVLLVFLPWFLNNAGLRWLTNQRFGWLAVIGEIVFEIAGWLAKVSPIDQVGRIMATGYSEPFFNYQVTSNLVGAAIFFLLAWGAFVFIPQEETPVTPGRGLFANPLPRLRFMRISRPWPNAIAWKDFHFIAGSRSWFLLKMLLYPALILAIFVVIVWGPGGRLRMDEVGDLFMVVALWGLAIEPIIYASRIFYDELKWKTLSTLWMVPRSQGEIVYSKIAGCLLGLVPGVFWFFVGAWLSPEDFGEAFGDLVDEPGAYFFVSQYFVFLHLVAFLSLYVKWGAVPLAFATVFLFNGCCISMIEFGGGPGGFGEGILVLLALLGAGICFGLHVAIAEGLRQHSSR